MQELYANVIIDISHEKVDHLFQYRVPSILHESIEVGMSVCVPFGSGNTIRTAYVIEIVTEPSFQIDKIKSIETIDREKELPSSDLIRIAWWMKKTYGSTMIQALKTVLPVKAKEKQLEKKWVDLNLSKEETTNYLALCIKKHYTAKSRLLGELLLHDSIPEAWVLKELNIGRQTIQGLENENIIKIRSENIYRNPLQEKTIEDKTIQLTKEQQKIVEDVLHGSENNQYIHMLKGITGSGKTQVYMEIIERVLARGKQAIVLIPEIALTYQIVMRFHERFGERISIMHSKLSPGERFDQMQRAKRGEIDIMIGPRSALFTPFPNLGVIVIDEEHESSYKSDTMPKYHAREVAIEMVRLKKAILVLGSATPSLETYYAYKMGEITGHFLHNRIEGKQLPKVFVCDLRQELKNGNRTIFGELLQEKIKDRLQKKEQIMLFINRRGYAGFISCRACGHVMKCPHCDVSLSEHGGGKLVCHYCGYEEPAVKKCPVCGSKYILGFRAGTEQIVELLSKLFPLAKVLRMDADTTKKKNSYYDILSTFANEEADILVGTQMIVKGHDFPKVTLVGILAADLSLSSGDFRAGEKTFQLLTQAAGRAGRGEVPGEVIIQTYQPEHYSILHAITQNYEEFYEEEIVYRELCDYPPCAHILTALFTSKDEVQTESVAKRVVNRIRPLCEIKKMRILGPTGAKINRINDFYRYVVYIKSAVKEDLEECKDILILAMNETMEEGILMQFDLDPLQVY